MPRSPWRGRAAPLLVASVMGLALSSPVAEAAGAAAVLPGSTGKEPISVDAAKLDYFDKEQKLVYSGDVVARQGASTLKGSVLTIFLAKGVRKSDVAAAPAPEASPAASSSIDRMEVAGPVTVISKDEIGTGDNGSYDKAANRITLTGNVTLTQSTNVIRGDKLVYDMGTGEAQVSSGQTQGRVRSVFTPGSGGGSPAATVRKPKPGTTEPAATGKGSTATRTP